MACWKCGWLAGQIDGVLWNLFLVYLPLYLISPSPLALNASDHPQIFVLGSNLPYKLYMSIYLYIIMSTYL